MFSGERWEALAAKGATAQRCLWASTSTKNPNYRDVLYVEELIGPDTVNTMPEETIAAFQDHGVVAESLEQGIDEARQVFDELREAGLDYDDVSNTLEREGVQKFVDSFTELKGKLAVANAKLAYQRYKELFSGARWEALGGKGATTQRCLWASTSTKNPEYRDVLYVEELIGPETVNTMPEETIEAFEDHGEVAPTLERDVEEAQRVFDRIAEAGVDYDDVVLVLEREGVQKFSDSFAELLDGVRAKRGELVSA